LFTSYKDAAAAQARTGHSAADPLTLPIEQARAQQDLYFQSLNGSIPAVSQSEDLEIQGPHGALALRLARPSEESGLPCIVFVRGAGWWAGGIDSHARTINTLANLSGCAVCAVDYRRTPEHAYPVQRDEVLATIEWLRREGERHDLAANRLVLFGESAGATLCLSAAIKLRDERAPLPAGLVLFYPNSGGPNPTARAYSQWVWQQYLGSSDPAATPGSVPMLQDLHGLPPIWLGCGEADPLMKDSEALARKLESAGVRHSLTRYPDLPHAFVMFSATLGPALDALSEAAAAVRSFLDLSPSTSGKD
jgi:acetyl esterase